MHNRTISHRQLSTVVFLALFALGTEALCSRLAAAGAAGWLCPILAGVIGVILAVLLRHQGLVLSGGRIHRVLAGILFLWGLLFGGAQASRIGVRLADALGASPAFLAASILILSGWMAAGGLPALARAGEIFLMALGSAVTVIFLGGVFRLRWDWILLWTPQELSGVPLGVLETLGLLAVGSYSLFLIKDVEPEKGGSGEVCRMIGRLSILMGAVSVLILGRFGAPLAGRMNSPFFQMVSGLGLEGAFQRLEQLVSALWVLGDLVLLGLLQLCLARLAAHAAGKQEKPWWPFMLAGMLFLLALPVSFWQGVMEGHLLWAGNLVAGGLILAAFVRKEGK